MATRRWIFAAGAVAALAVSAPSVAHAATANPTSLSFTGATLGTPSTPQTLPVTITVSIADGGGGVAIGGTNQADFSVTPSTCPVGDCVVNVTFTPQAAGTRMATLDFTPSVPAPIGQPVSVPLSGSTANGATLDATTFTFPPTQIATQSAAIPTKLTNTGNAPLTISSIALAGESPGDFALGYCTATPITLPAGGVCWVGAAFKPTVAGARAATMVITDNGPGGGRTIALGGTGTAPITSGVPGAPPPPMTTDRGPGGGSTDTGAPLISIRSPKANAKVTRTSRKRRKGKLVTVNKAVKVLGFASDRDGLARVEVAIVKGTKAPAKPKYRRAKLDDFAWSYSIPTREKLTAGTYTLLARAIDVKGVASTVAAVRFSLK